jgi:hypothetical protein
VAEAKPIISIPALFIIPVTTAPTVRIDAIPATRKKVLKKSLDKIVLGSIIAPSIKELGLVSSTIN